MEKVTTVRADGIPVHVVELPHVRDVAGGVLVNAGTVDESWPGEAGIAHATEHMLFRGNDEFPTSKDVTRLIEDTGGTANAFTFKEGTFYFGVVPSIRADDLFEYLANLVFSPKFRPSDIETEMGNVVQEIKKGQDNPGTVAKEQANEMLFSDHIYSRRILGSVESVTSFSRGDFLEFHSRLYNSDNVVFVVAGDITPEEVGGLLSNYELRTDDSTEASSYSAREFGDSFDNFRVVPKDIAQAHACLKALLPPPSDRETIALQTFATMVDGGLSFPMFSELRDKRGLCYVENASVNTMKRNSVFTLYVATSPDRVQEAIDAMLEVVNDSKSDSDLLSRAKSRIRGQLDRKHGKTSKTLQRMLEDILYRGEFRSTNEIMEEVASISIEEVECAVDKFLAPDSFAGSIVAHEDFSL